MAKNALTERLGNLTLNELLAVWDWTTSAENEQVPTIRGAIMDELERRNLRGFNAWLDLDAPEDKDLHLYMRVNPMCLNCKHWQGKCIGTNEQAYTGCIRKELK